MRRRRAFVPAVAKVMVTAVAAASLVMVATSPASAAGIRCQGVSPIGAALANSTYSLERDATLRGWGDNYFGQLGNGQNRTQELTPIQVPDMSSMVSVSAGGNHVLALESDGTVWAWGINWSGQLGNGTTGFGSESAEPTQVAGLEDVVQVAAGADNSFAVKRDGTVWAWGRNDDGQLGDGTFTDRLVPTQIPALTGVTQIAPGGTFTLALRPDGKVWSFGRGTSGQLGRGADVFASYPDPGLVQTSSTGSQLTGVTAIAAGGGFSSHSMALLSGGTVRAWGYGAMGQLGDGTSNDRRYANGTVKGPGGVGSLTGVTAISAGGYFSLARLADGTVWSWGQNAYWELGNTAAELYQKTPVQVQNLTSATAVAAGGNHSIALRSNGQTRTWGYNSNGGVGDGSTAHRGTPFTTSVLQELPKKPTEVEVVAGERLAYLTWTVPQSVTTQYVVTPYVNGVAQPEVETKLPEAKFPVRDLAEGTTYSFKVAAQNCLGTGVASDETKRVVPTGVQLNEEGFKVEGTRLTDRMQLKVNTFNGDLGLEATDLQIAGTGLDLVVARTWDSRSAASSIFGNRWTSTVGDDVFLEFLTDGSVMFHSPGGGTAGFAKDGTNYLTPAGVDATLVFDDNGTSADATDDTYLLTAFTGAEKYVFDATSGKLLRREDRNGNALTYTYSGPGGSLSSITDTQSRSLAFTYNAAGLVEKITDPIGREVRYTYDAGNLVAARDANGKLTTFTYVGGDLTSITTPAGRRVDLTYDGLDRVTTIAWPLAAGTPTTTFTYEFEKTVVTDANGRSTTYRYDPVGRTTSVVDALGNATSMEYTSHSNIRRYTPGGGGTTTWGYSSVHALTSAAAPTGADLALTYGDSSHPHLPTTIRDTQGKEVHYAYDSKGNLTRLVDDLATQNQVDVTYNSKGRPTSTSDPNGNATGYTYDPQGNLTGVTPPAPLGAIGPVISDAVSRLVSVTDGAGKTTGFQYDALDRLTKITYDDGSVLERAYDEDGNLVTETDALGTTTMTYDPKGRLVSRTTPDGVTVDYTYDKAGNLVALGDPSGTVLYGYNAVNLVTSVRLPDGKTITMTYDANYNRTSVTYPDGVTQTYAHDDSNRVTRVTTVDGSVTLDRFDYSYANPATGNTDSGLRFSVTDLANNKTAYSYDALNRLTKARTTTPTSALVVEYQYAYDGAGNRVQQTITTPSAAGPLTTLHIYAYNGANQLDTVDGENLTYDANGNLTGSDLGTELTYDAGDRTRSIRPRADQGIPLRFVYRGQGQSERVAAGPIAEHVSTGGPVCVPAVGCQADPNQVVGTSTYEHTALGLSAEEVADVRVSYVRDPYGGLLAQRAGNTTQYLLADGLGSVVRVNDHTAGTVATYRYDPFGAVAETTGAPAITPFRFAGYYLDATGLYKVGERYYDPDLGRWTQQDPVHNPFDPKLWNRYVYVGNDPVNYVDPDGLAGCKKSGGGLFDFFDKAWDFVSDTVFTGGMLGAAVRFGITALTTLNPVTSALAVLGAVASAAIGGYGLYRTAKSYANLQSGC